MGGFRIMKGWWKWVLAVVLCYVFLEFGWDAWKFLLLAVLVLLALFLAFGGLTVAIQKFFEFSDRLNRND